MPSASAIRRMVSASGPSASSSSRATAAISFLRSVFRSATDEPVLGPEVVAGDAVDGDVQHPGYEEGEQRRDFERGEGVGEYGGQRDPGAVHCVVDGNGPAG